MEFPRAPLSIGNMPIKEWALQNNKAGRLQLLTPTHSVMDRLAGYFHWNDKQNLEQAIMIALRHPVKMKVIKSWAKGEGETKKFEIFLSQLSQREK